MSYVEDLNGIQNPSLTDLLYIYQNGADFKVTNQQLLDLIKTNTVIPITQANYDLLPSADKNNGAIYIITDASITADDVEYSSGVSVGDKLDELNDVLTPIGTTQSAAWIAASASAFDTPLTGSITLDKGIYLITIATPVMNNNTETLQLSANSGSITKYSTSYPNIATQSNNTFVIAVTSATANVQVKTGGSIANSYSYLERGGLFATRIK